jgi:dethiobiotin synthetase
VRGCFVTGTDTGAGKTVLAAALVALARSRGVNVIGLKPVISGLAEPADSAWPPDHELLARAAGTSVSRVTAVRYAPPVSPHLAAELAGRPLDPGMLEEWIREAAGEAELVVVEGVGGLLVPLAPGYDVRRLAASLRLPLLVAARPGLGTINHTLLTLEAARAAGLEVTAVVLTPWPASPRELECSNRATIAALGRVDVEALGEISRAEPDLLAAAGAGLPLERWLSAWGRSDRPEE